MFGDGIVKLEVKEDEEESARIKESAILALGKLFKETKDAKGNKSLIFFQEEENHFKFF